MSRENSGLFEGVARGTGAAIISADGKYRYTLERRWADAPRYVLWLMLNPSTADADTNDATIRRCLGYTREWGYTGILVGNLYAYRATNPLALFELSKKEHRAWDGGDTQDLYNTIIGGENDAHLRELVRRSSLIVCAWGVAGPLSHRRWDVMRLIRDEKRPAHALKWNFPTNLTRQREPSHPLRLRKGLQPQAWEMFPNLGPGAGA